MIDILCYALFLSWISYMVFLKKKPIRTINLLPMQIELRVTLFPTDYVHKVIVVCPGCHENISVGELSSFHEHNPDRPAVISLFVHGYQVSGFCLSCREFISYQRLVFGLDFQGFLVITGIKAPQRTLQGHNKGTGWLFRGEYDGMKEVVVQSGLLLPATGYVIADYS